MNRRPHKRYSPHPSRGRADYLRAPWPPPPVNGYSITLVSPVSGAVSREPRPAISFIPTSVLGDPVDVQVEWRTSEPRLKYNSTTAWEPEPTYFTTEMSLSSGDTHTVRPPTDLTHRTWWYRLRAGRQSTNVWGSWTATDRKLDVQPTLGSVAGYIDLNIGVANATQRNVVAYLDMNIGVAVEDKYSHLTQYSDINIGVHPNWVLVASYLDMNVSPTMGKLLAAAYTDMNVNTEKPDPVIWWIRPEQGREGYIFNIYGHGFGDFENQYDGVVKLGDYVCQISRWEKIPATGELPYIKHGTGLEPDKITVEHGWIVAIVPTGAVSAMVKVILEGGI